MSKPKWFVSRQGYWGVDPDDMHVVEIAEGGIDYANPDMIVQKYPGEGQEYTDPREAVTAAIAIAEAWAKDQPDLKINIGEGYTMGMTMPFEGQPKEDLIAWAEDRWTKLAKCPTCGEIMEGAEEYYRSGVWTSGDFFPDDDSEKFCSEICAEKGSQFECQGDMCGTMYSWEARRMLSETTVGTLCPICYNTPCVICGVVQGDHDPEDGHDFEEPDWVENFTPGNVKCWDNEGETFDRYTACFWDNSYIGMSEHPFHPQGFGQHGEGKSIYNPELQNDERGTFSHLGRLTGLDYLPTDCIKLVMQDLIAYTNTAKEEQS